MESTDVPANKRGRNDLEELNERLEEAVRELAAANKEIDDLSYAVSHDLRAPLRHMSGFVGLLQKRLEGHPDEKIRHYASAIAGASQKMSTLIEGLLDFSRMGRREMKKTRVNIDSLVRGIVGEIMDRTKGREIIWRIGELPDVCGDQSMLRIVFVNLLSNAVKFTSGRPQAEIDIGCKEDGNELVFSVNDNGAGFNMKYADRLFAVFQRLHTGDEFEGTGIGLANTRRIISRHGGRIWAEGSEGQGAAFYFTLPFIPS